MIFRHSPRALGLLTVLSLAGCQNPPASVMRDHASDADIAAAEQPAGKNQVGEACRYRPSQDSGAAGSGAQSVDVFCGTWQQPSGHVQEGQSAAGGLANAAMQGTWRATIDQRLNCGAPSNTTSINGAPAVILQCNRKSGGWPHVAMVAELGGKTVYMDGVPSALPALETAMAGLTGIKAADVGERSTAAELISSTVSSKSFGAGDLETYYRLKRLGDEANDAGDYASAEQGYRAALDIQRKVLGPDNVGLAVPLMTLALQVSNQDRFGEADNLFMQAQSLIGGQPDPLLRASLNLYLAEDASNRGQPDKASKLVNVAETQFETVIPFAKNLHATDRMSGMMGMGRTSGSGSENIADSLFLGPEEQSAVSGLAATWWFQAYLAYKANNYTLAEEKTGNVRALLKQTGLNPLGVLPRTLQIAALSAGAKGDYSAGEMGLENAAMLFETKQANKRAAAINYFLAGRSAAARKNVPSALNYYRKAAKIAHEKHIGIPAPLVDLYLATLNGAEADPAKRDELAKESFEAMQLVETGQTSAVLAKAFARLSSGDSATRDLLRSIQDMDLQLRRLSDERDLETQKPAAQVNAARVAEIDKQVAELQAKRGDAESAAQAASPEYAQLEHNNEASIDSLQTLLRPDEAMLAFQVAADATYAVLIGHSEAHAYKIALGSADLAARVTALRKTIEMDETVAAPKPPVFDVEGAHDLYDLLFGPIAEDIKDLKRLVVVPSGALTALPLEVLVTEKTAPVTDGNYGNVPFLVEKLALSYIPSAQNLVVLRQKTKASAAPAGSYAGFGDFRPATPAQLAASFPSDRCKDDLAGLEQLPLLPGTEREVSFVGHTLFNAPAQDIVLGAAFTKARIQSMDLSQFRIVHFATHALLPTDLSCRSEPTIVVSPDIRAPNADSAFLGVGDILNLKLDADLVLLSACNTGPQGKDTGDSLSGLARSFFFAGARGLLVTHWALSDLSGPVLTALTLQPSNDAVDTAQALQQAKLNLMHDVARKYGEKGYFYTHPFAWAPFVLIGDGAEVKAPAS
jgi:CHAT domain-containing protein